MTRSLLILLSSQVVLEAALVALFWVIPGGRAVVGMAPALGIFAGAFAAGRAAPVSERSLVRRQALVSGIVHALLGGGVALALDQAWFLPLLGGGTAWVLSIAGLDFGQHTDKR